MVVWILAKYCCSQLLKLQNMIINSMALSIVWFLLLKTIKFSCECISSLNTALQFCDLMQCRLTHGRLKCTMSSYNLNPGQDHVFCALSGC